MSGKAKFKGGASAAIHASAKALHKVGAIDDRTMRGFDARHRSSPDWDRGKTAEAACGDDEALRATGDPSSAPKEA